MPTYVYKFVDSGETIEVQQAFTDESLTEYVHPQSGELLPVKKVFQPVGVTFKGSGFFKTDNRGSQQKSSTKTDGSGASTTESAPSKSSGEGAATSSSTSKDSSTPTKPVAATSTTD
ncbi:MAG: FmdB family transcriptional regulator [Ilumatobacter sp.]|nr:FmdB family transcriptional regulator [Ilumatobacter sp.]